MHLTRRIIPRGLIAMGALAMMLPFTAAHAAAGRVGQPRAHLSGVSCPSTGFCVAVGNYTGPAGKAHALAERWNGRTWQLMTGVQGTSLGAVSCPTTRFCMATGGLSFPKRGANEQIAESWRGHGWRLSTTPQRIRLNALSCTRSTFCVAVGSNPQDCEAGAVWRGVSWHQLPMPSPCGPAGGSLGSVSCVTASDCTAAGSYPPDNEDIDTLAEHWNGQAWSQLDSPNPGAGTSQLSSVSCTSAAFCMLLGSMLVEGTPPQCPLKSVNTCSLVLTWSGSQWQQLVAPQVGLSAVSCQNQASCMNVGTTLSAQWNGTSWQSEPLQTSAKGDLAIQAVSCRASAPCMAVGWVSGQDGLSYTLAEQWNGTSWQIRTTPNP